MTRLEPAFEAPWHAQLFALTLALHDAGHFSWPDWTEAFGATLRRNGLERDLDGGDDYFSAWLETLEALLAGNGLACGAAVSELADAWRAAYLSTPHGKPVSLPG